MSVEKCYLTSGFSLKINVVFKTPHSCLFGRHINFQNQCISNATPTLEYEIRLTFYRRQMSALKDGSSSKLIGIDDLCI